jgi:hypothetical protein
MKHLPKSMIISNLQTFWPKINTNVRSDGISAYNLEQPVKAPGTPKTTTVLLAVYSARLTSSLGVCHRTAGTLVCIPQIALSTGAALSTGFD